jgi:cytochrome c oxidase assembly factor CtaG
VLPEGARFRIFLGGYLVWRVVIDFLKPQPLIGGMNLIQWCCLAGIALLVLNWAQTRQVLYDQLAG